MTEYSGFKYATFFLAEYIGMFAITGLAATLFLGGWHSPMRALEFIPSYVWFFAKLSALLFVYVWVRGTLPRTRIDQIMNFAWKFMLPMSFACVIAAAVWYYAGRGARGWLWSVFVIVLVYSALAMLLDVQRKFAPRTYRFAE
jgi:NADH-quinone oxidoreductase subunit H